jgi:hypothetical protein
MTDLVAQLRSVQRNPVGGLCVRAADRIETLEAALREIDAVKYYGMEGAEMECKEMHDIARKALDAK